MIVCHCNRITDSEVRAAIRAGAKRPVDVFTALGVERACGQCLDALETVMDDAARDRDRR